MGKQQSLAQSLRCSGTRSYTDRNNNASRNIHAHIHTTNSHDRRSKSAETPYCTRRDQSISLGPTATLVPPPPTTTTRLRVSGRKTLAPPLDAKLRAARVPPPLLSVFVSYLMIERLASLERFVRCACEHTVVCGNRSGVHFMDWRNSGGRSQAFFFLYFYFLCFDLCQF